MDPDAADRQVVQARIIVDQGHGGEFSAVKERTEQLHPGIPGAVDDNRSFARGVRFSKRRARGKTQPGHGKADEKSVDHRCRAGNSGAKRQVSADQRQACHQGTLADGDEDRPRDKAHHRPVETQHVEHTQRRGGRHQQCDPDRGARHESQGFEPQDHGGHERARDQRRIKDQLQRDLFPSAQLGQKRKNSIHYRSLGTGADQRRPDTLLGCAGINNVA